jgi:hypothetical protein
MLRFVPDPARGEFINIGAIAGDDDSGEWELRLLQNPSVPRRSTTRTAYRQAWGQRRLREARTIADMLAYLFDDWG